VGENVGRVEERERESLGRVWETESWRENA
jgi:hypothetical protein